MLLLRHENHFALAAPSYAATESGLCYQVNRCLSIKGAEDTINKPFAFEISTIDDSMFFIADSEKVLSNLIIPEPNLHFLRFVAHGFYFWT